MLRGVSFAVVLALAASSCSSGTNDGSAAPETPPTAAPAVQETDPDQSGDLALAIEKLASSIDLLASILAAAEDEQDQVARGGVLELLLVDPLTTTQVGPFGPSLARRPTA